ncbi:MAG: hypothetical protein ACOX2O_05620 [Bdellovibrionota bacterium]|jgi:hypothetical protein
MLIHGFKKSMIFLGVSVFVLGASSSSWALPFSAESTSRESVKVTRLGDAWTPSTYAQLTRESSDLRFQITKNGQIFLAFVSKDASIDDLNWCEGDGGNCGNNLCTNDKKHVYWVEKTADKPAVCVSTYGNKDNKIELTGDSSNPRIGGSEREGQAGRYVAFETFGWNQCELAANDCAIPGANQDTCKTYANFERNCTAGSRQIIMHDRKWEESWLSSAKECGLPNDYTGIQNQNEKLVDYTQYSGAGGVIDTPEKYAANLANPQDYTRYKDSYLYALGKDGKNILFASAATQLVDNTEPKCVGGFSLGGAQNPIKTIYTRDGSGCKQGILGKCQTNLKYDRYALHAHPNGITVHDADAFQIAMSNDAADVIVFATKSTVPVHYQPDPLGFSDIFAWEDEMFSLISQVQSVYTSEFGEVSLVNIGGPAHGNSYNPTVSSNGKLIAFDSDAEDLVLEPVLDITGAETGNYINKSTNGHRQIFLFNYDTYRIEMVSVNPNGRAGNGDSERPFISADGRFVVFETRATDLIEGITTTPHKNIVVRDRAANKTYLVTTGVNPNYDASLATDEQVDPRTVQGINNDATITDVSPSGLTVAYQTVASDAINGAVDKAGPDTNGVQDVFLAQNGCPRDTDGDGTPDCLDMCPTDPNKHQEGYCGCFVSEVDSDNDGVPDCIDACPNDPLKTEAGFCGCGVEETDSDSDGVPDCIDECPANNQKVVAGACGCNALKVDPGYCGCDVEDDADLNGNGNPDCVDPLPDYRPLAPRIRKVKTSVTTSDVFATVNPRDIAAYKRKGANVSYIFFIRDTKSAKSVRRKTTKSSIKLEGLNNGVRYSVRYRIIAGSVKTLKGRKKSFTK